MTLRTLATGTLGLVLTATGPAFAEPSEPAQPEASARAALVWIFGDDDVFRPPNESSPPSPAAGIGDRAGYDPLVSGYASRYTGRENRLELRLRGEASDFVPSLATSAELALGLDMSGLDEQSGDARGAPVRVEDLGSFIELRLPAVALRLYPIFGDFERVGWLEMLGFGGAVGPERESPYATAAGPVRAARFALELAPFEFFAGFKTATFVEPVSNAPAVAETSYGAFGGLEARPAELVALGVAGGYFEHGLLEGAARNARATTAGGSARLVVRRDRDEPRSPVAFLGPGDDPFRSSRDAPSGAFAVGIEAVNLVQRLGDFDRPGSTTLVPARAVALFGGARLGPFDASAALLVREPEFVMRNAPGVFAGQSLPAAAQRDVERAVLLANGVIVSELLRVDLETSFRLPAAVMLAALDRFGEPAGTTLVVNGPGDVTLLPVGSVPVPVLDARASVEARLSSLVSAVGWVSYRRDFNRIGLAPGAGDHVGRGFVEPNRIGYGLAARAVW
jgi:hypothetical protein